jgi:histidine triad (HIT) family protein|tara:strand:+ start:569 stop:928 length:360 start_codon:yes stop_codon:yes gene_type:complete
MYDKQNIFAKILRKEIPCKKIYENDYVLAFHDVTPQKKIHVLLIPKGEYVDLDHFIESASEKEIIEFNKGIINVVKILKISSKENGYRVLSNIGLDSGQEVRHLHYHIFGGEKVGKMVS